MKNVAIMLRYSPEPRNESWFLREIANKAYKELGHTEEGQKRSVRLNRIADMIEALYNADT